MLRKTAFLIALEFLFGLFIIYKIKYTEIDYSTYMQQVSKFRSGITDYNNLYGDSGPLVYPAGFLYIFSIFQIITNSDILYSQYLFLLLLISTLLIIDRIHKAAKIPKYLVFACILSKRIQSIFLLRLFNDPIALLFMYISILYLCKQKYSVASVLASFALSIKMNILLFAPGFALVLFLSRGILESLLNLLLFLGVQVMIGFPFLTTFPVNYIEKAFEFKRSFLYVWTVNWRFVPQEIFDSSLFSILLLVLHFTTLLFFLFKWTR